MPEKHLRIQREKKTIQTMIRIYCRNQHKTSGDLCTRCQDLLDYARRRLDKCPFQEGKTTCGNCKVHCYKPDMREKIREVMRYSGPRMLSRHPLLALHHAIDGLRKEPVRKVRRPH